MKKKVSRGLYWTPRIASIVFILFLTLFSFDVFDMGLGFWGTVLAFIIHSIPSLTLTAVLIIAWKHEIVGAIGFLLAALLYIIFVLISAIKDGFHWYLLAWIIQIAGIPLAIAILYWLGWKKKKR